MGREIVSVCLEAHVSQCPHCHHRFVVYAVSEDEHGDAVLLAQALQNSSFCFYCGKPAAPDGKGGGK